MKIGAGCGLKHDEDPSRVNIGAGSRLEQDQDWSKLRIEAGRRLEDDTRQNERRHLQMNIF